MGKSIKVNIRLAIYQSVQSLNQINFVVFILTSFLGNVQFCGLSILIGGQVLKGKNMIIRGLNFIETCSVCPEQYYVKDEQGNMIGYIRLRYGELTCEYPDVGGELIYSQYFDNDWMGCFESDEQCESYLSIIADKILEKIG